MTFINIGLLTLSALALLGGIFFLYRYLMRSHLFPQLPRVWRVEKIRFLLCLVVFIVCFAGFLVTGWLNQDSEEQSVTVIEQTLPTMDQPSFDGAPLPNPGQERALPPQSGQSGGDEEQKVVMLGPDMDKPALPGPDNPVADKPATTPPAPVVDKPAAAQPPATTSGDKPAATDKPADKPAVDKPAAQAPDKPGQATTIPQGEKPLPKPYVPEEGGAPSATAAATTPLPGEKPLPKPYVPEGPASSTPGIAGISAAADNATASGGYSVCVASYSTEAAAQSDLGNYQSLGSARIVSVDIPGKGRWHRVCLGQYKTQAEAQGEANKWRNSGAAKGAFVVRLP